MLHRIVPLLGMWLAADLSAQTRYARHLGVEQGLVPPYIVSLAQDPHGLLWIGTAGGLYRYDGVEMRRWAPETLRSWVSALVVSPDSVLVALDEDQGAVFTIHADGARPVTGPQGEPLQRVHHIAVDRSGTLWALRQGDVLYRDTAGRWIALHQNTLDGTALQRVYAARAGGALVLTSAAVWLIAPPAAPRRLAKADQPRHVLELESGRILVLTFFGTLLEIVNGEARARFDLAARGIEIAERNGTLWLAFDRYLAAFGPDGTAEVLGPDDGVKGGGPLLVDAEGTLWLGTGAGLLHFPEPDTRIWTERHGLPIAHTRFLAKTGDTLWVNTWAGLAAITRRGGAWRTQARPEWRSVRRLLTGDDGALRPEVRRPPPSGGHGPLLELFSFDTDADGNEWFGTRFGVFVARAAHATPQRVSGLPFSSDLVVINSVLHDTAGRTWLASERRICHAPQVRAPDVSGARWECDDVPSGHHVSALVGLPGGSVWASFVRGGVWRYRKDTWTMLGGRNTPVVDVHGLIPSPSGGVWLARTATATRVIEDTAASSGWQVIEELSAWHGLRDFAAADVLEEPDGTLWLASSVGAARIPAAARSSPTPPRRVILVDALVDGERVPLAGDLELPHDRNRLTLRFAAPSYRDPARLRYEVRLSPGAAWTPVSGPPVISWMSLRPGRYQAEVRASLDGDAWTAEPARLAFRVLPPWYATPWALSLFGLIAAAAVTAAYRARVAGLLRLERQRTRIAADLHDEMGSGLGSIGILSGVLANEPSDGSNHRRLATQIAEISQELGAALSDMVWSLHPRASTLEEVAGRLVEHGTRLFASDATRFAADFPDRWPAEPLDFPVRRAVLLIGLEALHNAARHAGARRVTLAIQSSNGCWQLVVEDDGRGLPDEARRGEATGVGLRSLQQRAREIGGRIAWSEGPAGGTRVMLEFSLSGRPMPAN